MQRLLGKQQFATVSLRAEEVNRALGDRLSALGRVAGMLDARTLADRAALAEFLANRPVLLLLFNGGVSVFDRSGVAIGEAPPDSGRIGIDYATQDSVAAALTQGKSTVGPPRIDPHLQAPVFDLSVPIRADDGSVIGVLTGATKLDRPNFLDQIMESYYGNSGYYLLVDPEQRQIVTDTGRKRILERLSPAGSDPLFDRFVAGSDETGITHNAQGQEILASARRIYQSDWFIIAALPTDEAFALIGAMHRYMIQATLLLTLLAGALTWWMIRRELAPMLSAVKTLATLAQTDAPAQALPVASHDEIGRLIDGFNHLLETLQQRETSLQNALRFQQVLMDAVPSPVFYKDANGVYLGCNQAYERYTGLTREQLAGRTAHELFPADLADAYTAADRTLLEQPGGQSYEASVVHADGTRHEAIFNKATFTNSESLIAGQIGVLVDITERKQAEERIKYLAFYDPLTGLPNRRLLGDRLRQLMAVSKRSGRYSALMFLDLDNFKPLNDRYGHDTGDLLLVEVASRLRHCVREADTVARFGGDEFVVALGDLSCDCGESMVQAAAVAEKIRATLAEPYRLQIKRDGAPATMIEHSCSASIGVALFVNHEEGIDDFIKYADAAMYDAKAGGRNQIRFHSPAD